MFTVSPEYASQVADLRAFTRELMKDAERNLGTNLDWVAVDHWNTDNPVSICAPAGAPTAARTWSSATAFVNWREACSARCNPVEAGAEVALGDCEHEATMASDAKSVV